MSELRNILLKADNKSMILMMNYVLAQKIYPLCIVSQGLKRLSDLKSSYIFTSHLHQLKDLQ